jgi:DNA-binding transcriptional MocR family regulator
MPMPPARSRCAAPSRGTPGDGLPARPAHIIVTNGCREAIVLCLRAVTQPGDVVALESPTYFGLLEILRLLGLRALEIPTHPRHGIALDALQFAFDTQPVKALLVVPTLSNPLGASMPVPERRRLAQMAAERGLPVIEDAIYNDLSEQADRRRAVRSFDPSGHVMLCGSFSKTIAPGISLGWVDAGRWHRGAAAQGRDQRRADGDARHGDGRPARPARQRGQLPAAAHHHRRPRRRGAQLIARSFPRGTRVTDPPGGYILWVELPAHIDSQQLFEACLQEHILIAPGGLFSASDRYRHCIRLGVGPGAPRSAPRRYDDGLAGKPGAACTGSIERWVTWVGGCWRPWR